MSERNRERATSEYADLLREIDVLRSENDGLHRENTALHRINDKLRSNIAALRDILFVHGINNDQAVECELDSPLVVQGRETAVGLKADLAPNPPLLSETLNNQPSAGPEDGYQISLIEAAYPVEEQPPVDLVEIPTDNSSASVPHQNKPERILTKKSPEEDRISLFLSLFCGRQDVYARRWNSKEGKSGYSPACNNEWVKGVCGKPKLKCAECKNAQYLPYDGSAVRAHLRGQQTMGIYPLLKDDTCCFLAIDFDEDSWRKDVQAVRSVCLRDGIPCSVEISRSGNGAHLWFFLSAPLSAKRARSLGSAILTRAMDENARLKLSSYDRMFPNQDTMPKGGFGNLIALPFQIEAYKRGGCLFVDEQFQPYSDQWAYLSTVARVSGHQIDAFLSAAGASLGVLKANPCKTDNETSEPWKREALVLAREDFPIELTVILADRLYIPVEGLSDRAQNQIKRLAAFHNPEFFQAQAMRMPVWNKP